MFAATALAGLLLGLLIGAPAGFTYAVARRGWVDRDRAREQAKKYQRDAQAASRNAAGWLAIGLVVLVVGVACMVGTGRRDAADPNACPPASASRVPPAPGRAESGPARSGPAVAKPAASGRRAAAAVGSTGRRAADPCH